MRCVASACEHSQAISIVCGNSQGSSQPVTWWYAYCLTRKREQPLTVIYRQSG